MRRKNGFSLVELLIVLAVIAALIAVVTPIALNAISKAKATQVAENIRAIANAIENKAYLDGSLTAGDYYNDGLSSFVKDAQDNYSATIAVGTGNNSGTYTVTINYTKTDVNRTAVADILGSTYNSSTGTYEFSFVVY